MGIGDFIRDRMAGGMANEDILPLVKTRFPAARTTLNSIRWYRTNPRVMPDQSSQRPSHPAEIGRESNSRYKNHAIGNAQNGVIRNILCNIGQEAFTEADWNATKAYFLNRCVYCDEQRELIMDHAIPINKARLGEHRIGNLVPCCQKCNAKKGGNKDFREFLEGDDRRAERISAYMRGKNYTPVGDNEQVKILLECAYKEVAAVAARYATIINIVLSAKMANHDAQGGD